MSKQIEEHNYLLFAEVKFLLYLCGGKRVRDGHRFVHNVTSAFITFLLFFL